MSRRKLKALVFVAVAVASLGWLAPVGAFASSSQGSDASATEKPAATVGEFAIRLATALQLPSPRGGFQPETASYALWQAGVKVQPNLRKPLTESDVTELLGQMGLSLSTENPAQLVSSSRAGTIVSTFVSSGAVAERLRRSLTAAAGNGGDDFNNGNGKGGKFKRKKPTSPDGSGDG